MTQGKNFSFGIDNVTFIDDEFEVFSVDDPQNFSVDLQYETAEHRGGNSNDIRDIRVHSRSAQVSLGTGYVDAKLAAMLAGGTITSLGTSAASITTGTASGVNTLYGDDNTIPTAISTITINSPTLVKTSDYYIKSTAENQVQVTRVDDGKVFDAVTIAASTTGYDLDSERGIEFSTTSDATSLTVNEKAYVSSRTQIKTINQKIAFDTNIPGKLTMRGTVRDAHGYERIINIPLSQPTGSIQGNGATEFQIADLTFPIKYDTILDELCDVALRG